MNSDAQFVLYSMPEYGFGLIILDSQGVRYPNQTAGTACNQKSEIAYPSNESLLKRTTPNLFNRTNGQNQ